MLESMVSKTLMSKSLRQRSIIDDFAGGFVPPPELQMDNEDRLRKELASMQSDEAAG
jgi:hypothetical protein